MGITRAEMDALKRTHPLEDIVSQTVQLVREGKAYKGLCPFHAERTPSFFVYPDPDTGGRWYCFSARCQQGGDVFKFLQLRDSLDFPQALAYVRDVALPVGHTPRAHTKPRTWTPVDEQHRALQVAVDLYARRLWQTRGHPGRQYLAQRGITEHTAREYRIGYCSGEDLTALLRDLQGLNISAQAAKDIGVLDATTARERFAERIIIPEMRGGQARWMTGRHVRDVQNKYLNVYGPRHILGADTIYGVGEIIGDEGPFNWLTLCQWRLPAFSYTGGSLPEEGYQWLHAARRIYLPFNRDQAGWDATRRLAPKLEGRAEIVCLPARWQGRDLNDINDLECASATPYEGYHLFTLCGRAALPWHDRYLTMDFPDLPIVMLSSCSRTR